MTDASSESEITEENYTGDVPETAVTNEMAAEEGFPARTAEGELVAIVRKEATGTTGRTKLIDADDGEWEDLGAGLVEWVEDRVNPTAQTSEAAPEEPKQQSGKKHQPDEPPAAA